MHWPYESAFVAHACTCAFPALVPQLPDGDDADMHRQRASSSDESPAQGWGLASGGDR